MSIGTDIWTKVTNGGRCDRQGVRTIRRVVEDGGPHESVRVAIDGHNRALVTVNNGTIQAMVNLALTALRELANMLCLVGVKIGEQYSD